MGGTPAKEIRKRFSPEKVDYLLKTEWWKNDLDWFQKNAEAFESYESFRKAMGESSEESGPVQSTDGNQPPGITVV